MKNFELSLLFAAFMLLGALHVKGNDEDESLNEPVKYVITSEVWLDLAIKDSKDSNYTKKGRVWIGLFGDTCPMTTTNFAQLAKGFKRENVIIKTFLCYFLNSN